MSICYEDMQSWPAISEILDAAYSEKIKHKNKTEIEMKAVDPNEIDLAEGTLVSADFPNTGKIVGRICGLATTGHAVIGKTYIIKVLDYGKLDRKIYPYSCMAITRSMMNIIEVETKN